MKAIVSLIGIILLSALFSAFPVEACWIGFSTEELVERADLIVIGEIKSISGTEKAGSIWMTNWEVEVQYSLKGDPDNSLLIVTTPGAQNKQTIMSTSYRLDEWGNTVMLFLVKRDGYLEPLSPQGVVALDLNDSLLQYQPTGEYLMEKFNIVDQNITSVEKKELESYIVGVPQVVATASGSGVKEGGLLASPYILPAVLLLLILAGLFIFIRSIV
ncbi:MAG: hypothetical protein Q7J85_06575 [Bacillota bacterium]|nr:hypothetical protein [Bacillota bacterium]